MGKRHFTDEQEAEIVRRHEAEESAAAIARSVGVSPQTVLNILDRRGAERRSKREAVHLLHGVEGRPSAEVLRSHYWGPERLSIGALGQRFGVSGPAMRGWLKEGDIPRRNSGEQLRCEFALGRMKVSPNLALAHTVERDFTAFVAASKRSCKKAARLGGEARRQAHLARRKTWPCGWCGAPVSRPPHHDKQAYWFCSKPHAGSHSTHRFNCGDLPRPLILALFRERMAELRKQGLPIGAATMQKAAEPIGAGGIELEAYLLTLTPREMDEYLDNQLEHDVRAAGL